MSTTTASSPESLTESKEGTVPRLSSSIEQKDPLDGFGAVSTVSDSSYENEENDPDIILSHLLEKGEGSWTAEEEKKVRRKTDWRVMIWACAMFFSLELDRANISNVLTTDFLVNNGMTNNDYNVGQSVFLVCFLVMEIPSQMIIRYLGPEVWIPVMMSAWGIVAFCQAFINNRASFLATRALLGLCEGGFIPGLVLYLSSFYKSKELAVRYSWIWSASQATDIVSSLLAVGILQINSTNGWYDWQWLFLIEGLLTAVIGISTAFVLPSVRRKHISRVYTAREVAILRAKVILDDSSKSRALERDRHLYINVQNIISSFFDPYLFPVYFLGFFGFIPSLQGKQYLTINLKAMEFTTLQCNLLAIPASAICILCMCIVSKASDKFKVRWIFPIIASVWVIPNLIALIVLPESASRWARFVPLTLIVGYPYFHPIMIAWISENSNDHERRALASAWYNIFVQCGKLAGSNIYQDRDKPYYRVGNKALIGIACANAAVAVFTKVFLTYKNKQRERKLESMSREERMAYEETTTDSGNARLDFKLTI
ncbi:major facilitator superfamily domain-containing protein [Limtongia smithiae]|uniref:major facilitator superfamily domain-containing protein n=1 Tax=Limtongia smithiae TaxID=1125753 RepID=UPI0034CD198F